MTITQLGIQELQACLDVLVAALSSHNHQWTNKERQLYVKADDILALERSFENGVKGIRDISFPVDIKHQAVVAFADAMDEVLCQNDHKGGWGTCSRAYLRSRLIEEVGEYFGLLAQIDDPSSGISASVEHLRKELIDIANFAMMLWDRRG